MFQCFVDGEAFLGVEGLGYSPVSSPSCPGNYVHGGHTRVLERKSMASLEAWGKRVAKGRRLRMGRALM